MRRQVAAAHLSPRSWVTPPGVLDHVKVELPENELHVPKPQDQPP